MPGILDAGGQSLGVSCPSVLLSFYLCVDGAGNWRDTGGVEKNPWG